MNGPLAEANPFVPFARKLERSLRSVRDWVLDRRFHPYDLIIPVIYWAIVWFGILHHEPWSDEALPWIISRDTDWRGFLEMIFRNWDLHPGLFHALLIPFSRLNFPYFTQSVLNAFFALATTGLFVVKAPFSRAFRALFPFCFYMIYEYSVITRPYMLTVALIFSLAAFYPRRAKHPFVYATLISLLFHADYMGFGIGAALTLAFLCENAAEFLKKKDMLAAFLWMALNGLLILCVASSKPEGHVAAGVPVLFSARSVFRPLSNAFLPFYDLGLHVAFKSLWAVLSGAAALILVFSSLIRRPVFLMIYGVSTVFLFGVFSFFYFGDYRNHGFILITAIFCLWIAKACPESGGPIFSGWQKFRQWASRGAVTVICASILLSFPTTFAVFLLEYKLPFSGAEDMAKAILQLEAQGHIFEKGFIIVAPHKNSVGLMPYLPGIRFWNPCAGTQTEYYKATQKMRVCSSLTDDKVLVLAKEHFGDLSKILFLFRDPLPFSGDGEYDYQQVYAVPKAFGHWNETFFLYRPLPKNPPAPAA